MNVYSKIVTRLVLICVIFFANINNVNAHDRALSDNPAPLLTEINFNTYTPTSFGNQDVNSTMSIEEGGSTLHISGNSWKKISLSYTVTANTVLEFEFKSTAQGEVHGIGFDNNQTMSDNYTHKLYGTQNWGINSSFYSYTSSVPDWKHYQIRIGEFYTGNMSFLVFVNDHDVSNPTAHSYFRNVKVYEEDFSTPISPPVSVDFDNYLISPYDGIGQSPALTLTLEESGNSMRMYGNGWLKMSFPYLVTESTVIEFDFKSSNQGQIHGIGFDDDNSRQTNRTFQLYGVHNYGTNAFGYSRYAPEWKHYRIPIGKYYTGMMKYIFFVLDNDNASPPMAENIFKNLQVYEGEVSLPLTIDFNQYALSTYYSPQSGGISPTINILDNGNTLHLSGNGWTQISLPVNINSTTVLEFDFMSTSQGEVHALGFDTNQNADGNNTFKLYGTQSYGNTTFNSYTGSVPQLRHYTIPIGLYITGQQLYLFFGNDHDIANPTGNSYFSNVVIHNNPPTSPNQGSQDTCWRSTASWPEYNVSYSIDRDTIPVEAGWDSSIHAAAETWNNIAPSNFQFIYESSDNIISYGETFREDALAEAGPAHENSLFYIIYKYMIINNSLSLLWDTNNTPSSGDPDSNGSTSTYNLQNVITHEFGHWLELKDIETSGCEDVTMFGSADFGEIKKITLSNADIEAINWQYP